MGKKKQKFIQLKRFVRYGGKGDGFSVGQDSYGVFVYTHRARSKSYPTYSKIPKKNKLFIASTA